jgi:predicted RNA methylase
MKSIIIASVAMLGLTGCATLNAPLGQCTEVMYYNERLPQYAALGASAGTAAMVVLSDGNVGGTDALFGAATGALAGTVASGGLYTAEVCPSMSEVLKEVQ